MSSFTFGIAAALTAPLTMTLGFIVWDNHWTGSAFALNLFKCNLASVGFFVLAMTTNQGITADWTAFGYLALSAVIGIVIGDWTWLEGMQLLGARRVIIMDSLKPFLAGLLGWIVLDEQLQPPAWAGMVLTVGGVLLVSLESTPPEDTGGKTATPDESIGEKSRGSKNDVVVTSPVEVSPAALEAEVPDSCEPTKEPFPPLVESPGENGTDETEMQNPKLARTAADMRLGYAMSILNVVLDTYGALLTKEHGVGMTTWEINLIRFGFAGVVMLITSLGLCLYHQIMDGVRKADESNKADQVCVDSPTQEVRPVTIKTKNDDPPGLVCSPWYELPFETMSQNSWTHVSLGVLLVTFTTPALFNYALFQIAIAFVLTLGSLAPIYALPLTYLMQQEKPSGRACIGAVFAVAGVIVLSLFGTLETR